jgi:hypothetical protein
LRGLSGLESLSGKDEVLLPGKQELVATAEY